MASPIRATASTKTAQPVRSRPVALYLFALVLVILIPALVVSLVLLQRNNQAQEAVVRSLTNATVQAVVQSIDREVSGMVTTLRVLSSTQSLAEGDLAQFHDRAVVALAGTGAYLLLLDADFNQLLNTRVDYGEPLGGTSDPVSAQRALDIGLPTVSDLFFGQVAEQWVFNVLLPLTSPEGEPMLLALTQNAANLAGVLQSRELPAGWHAALVDSANLVIAATPDAELERGTSLSIRQTAGATADAEWRRETFGDQTVVTAEGRSGLTGWRVIAWASASSVDRPLDESLTWLAAWGIIIAATAGIVAFYIALRIGRSVRGLRRDAARLGQGEEVEAKIYPVAEIAEVSQALAQASEQRRTAEREVRFLMRELAHRSKNQMTVISAMAKQTARGAEDVPSYVQSFERRIMGLARSTDLLLEHGLAGVALQDLVTRQIAPFSPPAGNRVVITGPLVRLNAQAAQILGMAIHELSTNAVKYGAFSGDAGSLAVHWALDGDTLDFVWRETVLSLPLGNGRTGFGTTVIQSMVSGALGAEVERIAHADGIEWCFTIPLSAIDPDAAPTRPEPDPDE
jgi:two-component sensor histidine kinase